MVNFNNTKACALTDDAANNTPAFRSLSLEKSPANRRLATFIADLASNQSSSEASSEFCLQILRLIDELSALTREIAPIPHARFGNPAFRDWHSKAAEKIDAFFPLEKHKHLAQYWIESLGNPSRIDYGTGHELSFAIFYSCSSKSMHYWRIGQNVMQCSMPIFP